MGDLGLNELPPDASLSLSGEFYWDEVDFFLNEVLASSLHYLIYGFLMTVSMLIFFFPPQLLAY